MANTSMSFQFHKNLQNEIPCCSTVNYQVAFEYKEKIADPRMLTTGFLLWSHNFKYKQICWQLPELGYI